MSHAGTTITHRFIDRAKEHARYLAPKLVAFCATGLTVTMLIALLGLFGIRIEAPLATMLVGGISTLAAYIQRDRLLELAPGQLSLKVAAFLITSASATGVVAFAQQLGIDLTAHTAVIGLILTLLGTVLGFRKADITPIDLRDVDGVPDVSSLG